MSCTSKVNFFPRGTQCAQYQFHDTQFHTDDQPPFGHPESKADGDNGG